MCLCNQSYQTYQSYQNFEVLKLVKFEDSSIFLDNKIVKTSLYPSSGSRTSVLTQCVEPTFKI